MTNLDTYRSLPSREWLDYTCRRIEFRNHHLGDYRFDLGDILSNGLFLKYYRRLPRAAQLLLRSPEVLFPIGYRRLIGISETLVPVALYHLARFQLANIRRNIESRKAETEVRRLADLALRISLSENQQRWWIHPYSHHGSQWRSSKISYPYSIQSCAHHTARLGMLFLEIGQETSESRYIEYGIEAAHALLERHKWEGDLRSGITVSYYPDTDDQVINTSAEVGALFSTLPENARSIEVNTKICGITQTLANEITAEGAWAYTTWSHQRKWYDGRTVDNHHTAMNLGGLSKMLPIIKKFDSQLFELGCSTLEKGTRFYLSELVSVKGRCIGLYGAKKEATIAGYCEGIINLLHVLRARDECALSAELQKDIKKHLPLMLIQAIDRFLIKRTGDVATTRVSGLKNNIRSIRLGSGLLLDAISMFEENRTLIMEQD